MDNCFLTSDRDKNAHEGKAPFLPSIHEEGVAMETDTSYHRAPCWNTCLRNQDQQLNIARYVLSCLFLNLI